MRFLFCLLLSSTLLYLHIDRQNDLTQLRMRIPQLAREVRTLQEENTRLLYELDRFEHPTHLMHLAAGSEFAHLRHPLVETIVTLPQGLALTAPVTREKRFSRALPLVIGAKQ